jgi:hypothetical protein
MARTLSFVALSVFPIIEVTGRPACFAKVVVGVARANFLGWMIDRAGRQTSLPAA